VDTKFSIKMKNIVLSTRNIDDFASDVANEVVKKIELWNVKPPRPTETPDQWFDLNELVKYDPEKRTKPTFYGYIHKGIIPYHKRGKKLIFLKSEIDNWLRQGRKKTNAEIEANAENYLIKKGGSNE